MTTAPHAWVDELFRRESGRLVAALVRALGPAHVALAEDAVHDALLAALQTWASPPDDPAAWILRVAKNRAIDRLRREARHDALDPRRDDALAGVAELDTSDTAHAESLLSMMLAICEPSLSVETHVTLILRLLCGFSPAEIARAFLVDVGTIDRRLHRGRERLASLGALPPLRDVRAGQSSIEHALYVMFDEGYLGADPERPLSHALCADALHLAEVALASDAVDRPRLHALAALFCLHMARAPARLDDEGVLVPLAEQDRARRDVAMFERGVAHLGESAVGDGPSRWHLEAGIALEHARAPSFAETDWARIVTFYDALVLCAAGPVVALGRAMAIAELHRDRSGVDAARAALASLDGDPRLWRNAFAWAARADLAARAGDERAARESYAKAIALAPSTAERRSHERRLRALG